MFDLLQEKIILQGEFFRIVIAVVGTLLATWYDVKHNRNVPNYLLYGFLSIGFFSNLVFYQQGIFLYTISIALVIFLVGYVFYRLGYIGGADVFVLSSIALLLPILPSYINALFNFPPVLSIIIYSGILFALYFICFIIKYVIMKNKKGKLEYLLLLPLYGVLFYFFASSGIFGIIYLITVSILVLASILFMVYREHVISAMAKKIPLSKVEKEDIAVPELMPALMKKYKIKRLLDEKELERLKKLKLKALYVYTDLPPFLPFVLAGLILSITIGDLLMYSVNY